MFFIKAFGKLPAASLGGCCELNDAEQCFASCCCIPHCACNHIRTTVSAWLCKGSGNSTQCWERAQKTLEVWVEWTAEEALASLLLDPVDNRASSTRFFGVWGRTQAPNKFEVVLAAAFWLGKPHLWSLPLGFWCSVKANEEGGVLS